MTITESNWQMLSEIRKELGFDKEPEPTAEESRINERRHERHRSLVFKDRKRAQRPPDHYPKEGEIPLGKWIRQEAEKNQIALSSMWARFHDRNLARTLTIRRVNSRVMFVKI